MVPRLAPLSISALATSFSPFSHANNKGVYPSWKDNKCNFIEVIEGCYIARAIVRAWIYNNHVFILCF